MQETEFIPVAVLGDPGDGTTADFARSRGRWAALPPGWMSTKDMREELMRIARVPEYDGAAGEALLWSMSDFLEVRGSGRTQEFRRVETPPEPKTPAEIFAAEAARRAELEHERHERELQGRLRVSAERDAIYFDNQRRVWNELCDESVTPRLAALEARIAELEGQRAQHGELEAGAVSTATPTATASEASAESIRARARRFMFGDTDPAEIERLLEQDEDDD
jgi:hypothetical protein